MDEQDMQDHGVQGAKEGFRPVHTVVVIVILGALAAIAIPNFLDFRIEAKTSEAKSNLGAIRGCEVAYVAEWARWVGNQPYFPAIDRAGRKNQYTLPPAWSSSRFSILGFAAESVIFYSYNLEGADYPPEDEGFVANAQSDLDGDGELSTFTITNKSTEVEHSGDIDEDGNMWTFSW